MRLPICLATGLLVACSDSRDLTDAGESAIKKDDRSDASVDAGMRDARVKSEEDDAITYHGHIRALLETHCTSCHVKGGIGPMPLDDLESVMEVRGLVVAAVAAGIMPPWPASSDCRDLRDVRRLSQEQVELLEAWSEAGYPEGRKRDYEPPERSAVGVPDREPDLVLMPEEAYTPNPAITDEYRCFLTEGTFDEDTYLTGMDIRPGVRGEVHHVQVHKISVDSIEAIKTLDEQAAGPGYQCGGGAGGTIMSVNMFSWRPGTAAILFDEGDAALVEAGSAFVLQVHYNTQFLPEEGPLPDRSGVAFWTLAPGELPDRIVTRRGVFGPLSGSEFGGVLPAGESNVVGETTQSLQALSTVRGVYVPGEMIGMTPHMHGLGTRLSATLARSAGGDECMIDVPDWDFEWQLDYSYAEPVAYSYEDMLTVRCEYDNSAKNQPLLDGEPLTPRDVSWGEGSLDEMCLNYVWFRYDRAAFLAAYLR